MEGICRVLERRGNRCDAITPASSPECRERGISAGVGAESTGMAMRVQSIKRRPYGLHKVAFASASTPKVLIRRSERLQGVAASDAVQTRDVSFSMACCLPCSCGCTLRMTTAKVNRSTPEVAYAATCTYVFRDAWDGFGAHI